MSFDRIASSYRFLEWITFSNLLQRARTAFISQTADSRRALVVGEGDGRFLAELLRRNPEAEIDCVDASAAMIRCARARTVVILSKARDLASVHKPSARFPGPSPPQDGSVRVADRTSVVCLHRDDRSSQFDEPSRVKFHHADFLEWVLQQQPYDLVVTHFFLDCFDRDRLSRVITKLAHAAAPKSRWLVTDFAIPPKGLRRVHAKIWLGMMYSFFRAVADLEAHELFDPSPFIQETGFQLRQEIVGRFGLVKAQLWERLA